MTPEGLAPGSFLFGEHEEFFPGSPNPQFQRMPQTLKVLPTWESLLELRPSSSPAPAQGMSQMLSSMPLCQSGCLLTCSPPQSIIKLQDYPTQLSDRPPPLFIALLLRTADLSTEACFSQTLVRRMSWQPQASSETRNQSLRRNPSGDQ